MKAGEGNAGSRLGQIGGPWKIPPSRWTPARSPKGGQTCSNAESVCFALLRHSRGEIGGLRSTTLWGRPLPEVETGAPSTGSEDLSNFLNMSSLCAHSAASETTRHVMDSQRNRSIQISFVSSVRSKDSNRSGSSAKRSSSLRSSRLTRSYRPTSRSL